MDNGGARFKREIVLQMPHSKEQLKDWAGPSLFSAELRYLNFILIDPKMIHENEKYSQKVAINLKKWPIEQSPLDNPVIHIVPKLFCFFFIKKKKNNKNRHFPVGSVCLPFLSVCVRVLVFARLYLCLFNHQQNENHKSRTLVFMKWQEF